MHQRILWGFGLVLLLCSHAWAGNTLSPTTAEQYANMLGRALVPYVTSGCLPAVPAASMTMAAFACEASMVDSSSTFVPVVQGSTALTLPSSGDGEYWLLIYKDTTTDPGSWVRSATTATKSTHYRVQKSATQPTIPSGGLLAAQITVAGGVITAVTDKRNGNPSVPAYLTSELPAAGIAGRMARLRDGLRGVWIDTGAQWARQDPVIDLIRDFDLKCDGSTDDATTLNTALAAMNTAGTYMTARIPKACTAIIGSAVTMYSNVTLEGAGAGRTVLKQKASTQINDTMIAGSSLSNVTLRNLTLDGNRANQGAIVRRLVAINLSSSTDILVDGVECKNTYGIVGSVGICLAFGGTSARVTVQNSYIHDTGIAGNASDGIYFSGREFFATNNRFVNTTDTGVVCESTSTNSADPDDHCVIIGNTFRIADAGQAIAIDAAVVNTYAAGSLAALNTIYGGKAANGGAIRVYGRSGAQTSDNIVMGNILRAVTDGKGIFANDTSHLVMMGNLASYTSDDENGIRLQDANHVAVTGNLAHDGGGAGIGMGGLVGGLVVGNYTVNNGIVSAAPTGFDARTSAAAVASNNLTMVGNYCTLGASQTRCIQTANTINNLFLAANDGHTSGSDGFNLTAAGTPGARRMGNYMDTTTTFPGTAELYDSLQLNSVLNAGLGAGADGVLVYCSDCTRANPCAGGGTGAFARRIAGGWNCVD